MVSPVIVNVLRQAQGASQKLIGSLAKVRDLLTTGVDNIFGGALSGTSEQRRNLQVLDRQIQQLIQRRQQLRQSLQQNLGNPRASVQFSNQIVQVNSEILRLRDQYNQTRNTIQRNPLTFGKLLKKGLSGLKKSFEFVFNNILQIKSSLESATAGIRAFGKATVQAAQSVEQGVRSSAIVVSSITDVFDKEGNKIENFGDKIAALEPRIRKIQQNLLEAAPNLVGITSEDLLLTLEQVTLQFGQFQGQLENIDTAKAGREITDEFEAIELVTQRLSQGLKAFGLAARDIPQEVRALLTGDIDRNARFANQLGITGQDIARAKSQGELVQFLLDRTQSLAGANERYGDSLENTLSVLEDVQQQFNRAFGAELLDSLANSLLNIRKTLEDNQEEVNRLGESLGKIAGSSLEAILENIDNTIAFILENIEQVEKVAKIIVSTATEFLGIITDAVSLISVLTVKVLNLADTIASLPTNTKGWVQQLITGENKTKTLNENLKKLAKTAEEVDFFDLDKETESVKGFFGFLAKNLRQSPGIKLLTLGDQKEAEEGIKNIADNAKTNIDRIGRVFSNLETNPFGEGALKRTKQGAKLLLQEIENSDKEIGRIRSQAAKAGLDESSKSIKESISVVQEAISTAQLEFAELAQAQNLGDEEQQKNLDELLKKRDELNLKLKQNILGKKEEARIEQEIAINQIKIEGLTKKIAENITDASNGAKTTRRNILEISSAAEIVQNNFEGIGRALRDAAEPEDFKKILKDLQQNIQDAFDFGGADLQGQLDILRQIATGGEANLPERLAALETIEKTQKRIADSIKQVNNFRTDLLNILEKTGEISSQRLAAENKLVAVDNKRVDLLRTEEQIRDRIAAIAAGGGDTDADVQKLNELQTLREQQQAQLDLAEIEAGRLETVADLADVNKKVKDFIEDIDLNKLRTELDTLIAENAGELSAEFAEVRRNISEADAESLKLINKQRELRFIEEEIVRLKSQSNMEGIEGQIVQAQVLELTTQLKDKQAEVAQSTIDFINNLGLGKGKAADLSQEIGKLEDQLAQLKLDAREIKLDGIDFKVKNLPKAVDIIKKAKTIAGPLAKEYKEVAKQLGKAFNIDGKSIENNAKTAIRLIKERTKLEKQAIVAKAKADAAELTAQSRKKVAELDFQQKRIEAAKANLKAELEGLKIALKKQGIDPNSDPQVQATEQLLEGLDDQADKLEEAKGLETEILAQNLENLEAKTSQELKQASINGLLEQANELEKQRNNIIRSSPTRKSGGGGGGGGKPAPRDDRQINPNTGNPIAAKASIDSPVKKAAGKVSLLGAKTAEAAGKIAAAAKQAGKSAKGTKKLGDESKKASGKVKTLGSTSGKVGGSFVSDLVRQKGDTKEQTAERRRKLREAKASGDPRIQRAIEGIQAAGKEERARNRRIFNEKGKAGATPRTAAKRIFAYIKQQDDVFRKQNAAIAALPAKFAELDRRSAAFQQSAVSRLEKVQEIAEEKRANLEQKANEKRDRLFELIKASAQSDANLVSVIGEKAFQQRERWIELQQELLQEARDARAEREKELQLGENQVNAVVTLQDILRAGGGIEENIENAQEDREVASETDKKLKELFGGDSELVKAIIDGSFKPEDFETDSKLFLDPKTGELIATGKSPDIEGLNQLVELQIGNSIAEKQTELLTNIAENTGGLTNLSGFSDFVDFNTGVVRNAFGEVIDVIDLTQAATAESTKALGSFLTEVKNTNDRLLREGGTDERVLKFQERGSTSLEEIERLFGTNTDTLEEVQSQQESINQNQANIDDLKALQAQIADVNNQFNQATAERNRTQFSAEEFLRLTEGFEFRDLDKDDRRQLDKGKTVERKEGRPDVFKVGDRTIKIKSEDIAEFNRRLSPNFDPLDQQLRDLNDKAVQLENIVNTDQQILDALKGNPDAEAEAEKQRIRETVDGITKPLIEQFEVQRKLLESIAGDAAARAEATSNLDISTFKNIFKSTEAIGKASGIGSQVVGIAGDIKGRRFENKLAAFDAIPTGGRGTVTGGLNTTAPTSLFNRATRVNINNFPSDLGRHQTVSRIAGL